MNQPRHVSLELELRGDASTDSALAFVDPEDMLVDPIWIPRSQIFNLDRLLDGLDNGLTWSTKETVEIIIPQWLAEERGLDVYCEELEDECD